MSGDSDLQQLIYPAIPLLMLMGCMAAALIAEAKGRKAIYWMIWAFLFPPTVIFLLFFCKSNK